MKEKEEKIKPVKINCHPDLIKILDDLEPPIKDFTWGVVKIGYFEKTEILARKLNGKK